jgi:M3 family oligoendopeptidase
MPPASTAPAPRFEDISPSAPDLEVLAERAAAVCATIAEASSLADCLAAVDSWDAVRCEVQTYDAWVDLRFNQDTADSVAKAAREAWDELSPQWTELEIDVKKALLAHPLRPALEGELGAQAFALWESEVLAFDPTIKADLARELALEAEYTELCASAQVEFQGEKVNLSTLRKYRQNADRAVREGAERVLWGWFGENAERLDRIYGDMVGLRNSMAKKLGFQDFVELGYKRMCRVDYDRDDVERFRAEIVRDVVPLCEELHRRQAADLGLEKLMAWDEPVHDLSGNPLPKGDRAWQVERAQEIFDAMGSELGEFFGHLSAGGFLDLDARKGKAGGGFCTSFPSRGMPFVFANFNGTKGDVEVLTHEIGHAFQNYSSRDQRLIDYHWPTYESAEVHSMSLEFLTWPHMDALFEGDAERFRRVHLTESLLFLPYGTAVDHFQHLIYERPDATPAERHAMWLEMERIYLPWREWGGIEHPQMGGRWQNQAHIYGSPFYYIDYVLAQTCAMQFWARSVEDPSGALADYVALCGRGGSLPFQALVRSAGLVSPFDEGCLTQVVARVRKTLGV